MSEDEKIGPVEKAEMERADQIEQRTAAREVEARRRVGISPVLDYEGLTPEDIVDQPVSGCLDEAKRTWSLRKHPRRRGR